MIGALIGSFAGYGLGRRYLSGTREEAVWTAHLCGDESKPEATICKCFEKGKAFFRLYIVGDGDWACAGQNEHYAAVTALVQQWETYVRNGGTIAAWRMHNAVREQQVADLDKLFKEHGPDIAKLLGPMFKAHRDGTVEDKRS